MTPEELTALAEAVPEARQRRDAGIVQATDEGMKQRTIVEATKLTREQIRRIVKATKDAA
ncbi:MAG: hypothetical protein ACRD0P_07645 [Stackebrandtia sp.]